MSTTPQSSTTEQASPELTRLYMAIEDAPSYRQEIRAARMAAFVRACLPPASGEQPKGWREECSVNRAFDATYYVKEPWTGKLLQVGTGTWEGTNGDAYFATAYAARAALAQAPDPREPCRFSPGVCNDANCNDCGPLVAQHASTPSPVAPPVQTQGGDANAKRNPYASEIPCDGCGVMTPCRIGARPVFCDKCYACPKCGRGRSFRRRNGQCDGCGTIVPPPVAMRDRPASQPAPAASGHDPAKVEAIVKGCIDVCRWVLHSVTHDVNNVRTSNDCWCKPDYTPCWGCQLKTAIAPAQAFLRASRPATPAPAGRPTPEEFEAMFDRDMARTFTPPADTPQTAPSSPSNGGSSASSTTPATVPVPLELAREWQLTRKQLRSWLRGDCLASRLYDTLAAVVKEAKRGK